MATTRIIPMHKSKIKTLLKSLSDRIDYSQNADKTNDGEFISSYMCSAASASEEFLLSKQCYYQNTGRTQKSDVIAYQVRQSFKPNEVTAEIANEIGYKLAEKITKGNHSFIVATHIDKAHIHNHIIFNSTNLQCNKKFRNIWDSTKVIRRISDKLCLDYNLSVLEEVKPKGKTYDEWLGGKKELTHTDKLKIAIDEVLLEYPKAFDDFINGMKQKGYTSKVGKHIGFKNDEMQKFLRLKPAWRNHSHEYILNQIESNNMISKERPVVPKNNNDVNLIINLEEKMKNRKGVAYEKWAKKFNLKQLANTMNYLTEHNLLNYEELTAKTDAIVTEFSNINKQIKEIDQKMKDISELQKHMVNFAKTRKIYNDYKKSRFSDEFKNEHLDEITKYLEAKKYFDENGIDKFPDMKLLKQEYATLKAEKNKMYSAYNKLKEEYKEVLITKQNVDFILNDKEENQQDEAINKVLKSANVKKNKNKDNVR